MSFLLPLGLLALLALPIIVLLHFLRERRRRVPVPSLLLWENLPRRVDGERNRRLPITPLLLLHLLIAALLGLALGGPQIAGALAPDARHTAIILDTSTSMAALDGGTSRFEQARQRARAIAASAAPGDRITLITAGPRAQIVASGEDPFLITAALDRLQPGGVGMAINEALTLAEAALDPQFSRRIIVLTDSALPPQPARDVIVPVEWVTIGSNVPNRAIIAFASRPWGGRLQVYARVANYDVAPFDGTLRVFSGNQVVAEERITIAPNSETEISWTLPGSVEALHAEIDGRDALPQDDSAYLSVSRSRPILALLVSDEPAALRRALEVIPGVTVAVTSLTAYATASERTVADLTIFDRVLPDAWPQGAILAIAPPPGSSLLNVALETRTLEPGAPLYQRGSVLEGLEFGGVLFGAVRVVETPPWAEVQLASEQVPLILRGRTDNREIAVWTFNLADSNLTTRLAFPILVARTVRDLAPPPLPQAVRAGEPLVIRPDPRATAVQLRGPGAQQAITPAASVVTLDTLVEPGLYRVEEQRGNTTVLAGVVGVNAGAAIESNLRPQNAPPLRAPGSDPGAAAGRHRLDLWPWLALAALLVLALEWAYVLRRR
ncbi:MAG: VWA domain-containing protein [Roseiflexus sp.]|nr:VWA domain-containing protein [Roseiflexus sp.]MCS7289072.1 VWA domain-containing protein [Roseiflexus sp.]MDW8234094.1 VWA domain-containing protein [Roseiflexaceae bacterium]